MAKIGKVSMSKEFILSLTKAKFKKWAKGKFLMPAEEVWKEVNKQIKNA